MNNTTIYTSTPLNQMLCNNTTYLNVTYITNNISEIFNQFLKLDNATQLSINDTLHNNVCTISSEQIGIYIVMIFLIFLTNITNGVNVIKYLKSLRFSTQNEPQNNNA